MRLGQLARKTDQKPQQIVAFIKKQFDVEIGVHFNTKVNDEFVPAVLSHFASSPEVEQASKEEALPPDTASDNVPVESTLSNEESPELPHSIAEDSSIEAQEEIKQELLPEELVRGAEVDQQTIANAALIEVEKVSLTGPKVVGKIELPPPPPVKMVEVDGVMYSADELAKKRREERRAKQKARQERQASKTARKKKSLSPEQIEQRRKERDQQVMEEKIAAREKRIMAQQKAKKMAAQKQFKSTKQKVKKKVVIEKTIEKREDTPKTWYQKLWKWFNT